MSNLRRWRSIVRAVWEDMSPARKWRVSARLASILLISAAAYWFAALIQRDRFGWAIVPAIVLLLVSWGEFVALDLAIDRRFPLHTREQLDRLHRQMSQTPVNREIVDAMRACVASLRGCDRDRVSSAVHLTVDVESPFQERSVTGLVQISDYTRPGLGGRRWRVTESTKGIIGQCVRTRETVWVNFNSAEEYLRRMVTEFGYTREEAENHTDARSYLAHPLLDSDAVVGVLYFFSVEPQVFPHAADLRQLSHTADKVASLLRTVNVL